MLSGRNFYGYGLKLCSLLILVAGVFLQSIVIGQTVQRLLLSLDPNIVNALRTLKSANDDLKGGIEIIDDVYSSLRRKEAPQRTWNSSYARLAATYKDAANQIKNAPLPTSFDETKRNGLQPMERAILEIAGKRNKSIATVTRSYALFKEYKQYGSVNDEGKFIIKEYKWILKEE